MFKYNTKENLFFILNIAIYEGKKLFLLTQNQIQ